MLRALDFILWQIGQGKNFLRNCKPMFLQKFCLNFFNQYLQRHFVISAELSASVFLCLALWIGNCMPLYVKIFNFEGVVLYKSFFSKKFLHVFYHCLNQHLSIGNRSFICNSPGIYPRRENCWSDTAEIWLFSSFLLKNCSTILEKQWRYFNQQGIIGSYWQMVKMTRNQLLRLFLCSEKLVGGMSRNQQNGIKCLDNHDQSFSKQPTGFPTMQFRSDFLPF